MGFDLSGVKPKNKKGEYFRNNIWWWRPLWDYVCKTCDEFMTEEDKCKGVSNSGDVIGKDLKDKVLVCLKAEVISGRALEYEKAYNKKIKALPLVECDICKGLGNRNDEYVVGECNVCGGRGEVDDFKTSYPFDVGNVEEFIKFLEGNSGFSIY
jgi:hypothetical protein